jgi:hypothetical protein
VQTLRLRAEREEQGQAVQRHAKDAQAREAIMNAKEAKATATKRAEEIKKKREADERKAAEKHAQEWKDERENWYKNHLEWFAKNIADAVDKGKTETSVWLATSDEPEHAEEKAFWQYFAFKLELKKVIAHFEKLGYKLEFSVEKYENVDLSDLNPRDNWFTYKTKLDISW